MKSDTIVELQAVELKRLRERNRELLRVLKVGVELEAGELTGTTWKLAVREWLSSARTLVAKAEQS